MNLTKPLIILFFLAAFGQSFVCHSNPNAETWTRNFDVKKKNLASINSSMDESITSFLENAFTDDDTLKPRIAQKHKKGCFIVNLSRDTFPVTLIKHNLSRLICDSSGHKVKYKAKKILSFIDDGEIYDSGIVLDKGLGYPRWIFFHKIIDGDLCYYSYITTEKSISGSRSDASGEWDGNYYNDVTMHFLRFKNNERGRFIRIGATWRRKFKKFCHDCPEVMDQISKDGYWGPYYRGYVYLYNEKCGSKTSEK